LIVTTTNITLNYLATDFLFFIF